MAVTKTKIECQNIAPIFSLNKEISSSALKFGIFANNGSGKTFISRMFRLTEKTSELTLIEDGKSPTDKILSIGKSNGFFGFKIVDRDGVIKENFKIEIKKGTIPIIPKTEYLYHTFNQDYVEENIRTLSFDKDHEIEGFILGKVNIELKDEEEQLLAIEKQGKELAENIENEINEYLEEKINSIQNIKRLGEYKTLEIANIFNSIDEDVEQPLKTYEELIENYNKIKAVPENLDDIAEISRVNIDINVFYKLKENCRTEYSLSKLAEAYKEKIKEKQSFIELGITLLNDERNECPFCEQKLQQSALMLIDQYTSYLKDTEAQTIKAFKSSAENLETWMRFIKEIDNVNSKRINEFNIYKTKYIPSSESIDLEILEIEKLISDFEAVIKLVESKINDISLPVLINDELLYSIEKQLILLNGQIDRNNREIQVINNKKNRISEENKATRIEICKSAFYNLVNEHKTNIKSVLKLRADWKAINGEIKKLKEQQKVSKRSKVSSTIKSVLNYFFAEKYTLDEETFRLIFNKNPLEKNQAKDILSEGEKNIVAFAYFIGDTHLKIENEDDYKRLFFVIDDPISSMDFSHVYTICGVIRDLKKIIDKIEKDRLIIFTHNNDFMRVLSANNIIDKKLLLKNGELKDFNNNLTVPYVTHLVDIYKIARLKNPPTHTTANSIRHIIETLTKFEKIDISSDSIAAYIQDNIPDDKKSYTLINDLSHGGWRTEQAPINDDDYEDVCETIVKHIENKYKGQIEHCAKLCM